MPGPQRVSGLDASFLSLETATQPLQVLSVMELDPATIPGGYDFQRLRDQVRERVRAMPELREKLSSGFLDLDHPVWIEDEHFDIDVRQALFKTRRGRIYRMLFTIVGNEVRILRVRGPGQAPVVADDVDSLTDE